MQNNHPGPVYIAKRLKNLLLPPLRLRPWPAGIIIDRNVGITVRDGVTLRANVFRPAAEGVYPVIMSAHPYGKDRFNRRGLVAPRPLFQYRIMNQPAPVAISEWTSWEAPDPAFWVPRGYVVVNIDLRGFGTSDCQGAGELLSA